MRNTTSPSRLRRRHELVSTSQDSATSLVPRPCGVVSVVADWLTYLLEVRSAAKFSFNVNNSDRRAYLQLMLASGYAERKPTAVETWSHFLRERMSSDPSEGHRNNYGAVKHFKGNKFFRALK